MIYLFVSLKARRTYDKRHVDPIPPNYLLGKCAEDIESSEQHFVLPNDCRYNESSGTELESSGVTSNITLESLYCDETAEGTFNLNPGQAYER